MNIAKVPVFLVSCFIGLACSSSRVVDNVADAALVQDGSATTSQDGAAGSCVYLEYPPCNPNDQRVTSGPESDYSGDCPPERECYSLPGFDGFRNNCGSVLCVLPEGVHCDDPLSCNPGDTPGISYDEDCAFAGFCYTRLLCARSLSCIVATSACAALQSGMWTDGGVLDHPDASFDGNPAGRVPCCGDGIVDRESGEQCDLGEANGACFDAGGKLVGYPEVTDCPLDTQVLCTWNCQLIWDGP